MNKLLLALFLISGIASAQTYSTSVAVGKMCSLHGSMQQYGAEAKKKGQSKDLLMAEIKDGKAGPDVEKVIMAGFEDGESPKDAYMTGWAKCMDNNSR